MPVDIANKGAAKASIEPEEIGFDGTNEVMEPINQTYPLQLRRKPMSTKPDLLTPDNCQIIFIDHQPQMAFGVQSIDRQTLKNNVVALAKSAKVFGIPTTITTVETESLINWSKYRRSASRAEPGSCSAAIRCSLYLSPYLRSTARNRLSLLPKAA